MTTVMEYLENYLGDLEYAYGQNKSLENLNFITCSTPWFNNEQEADEYLEELSNAAFMRSVKPAKTIEEAEGHWSCRKFFDTDSDHGPCSGFEIEELGITIYTYREDPTRISIHRGS